MNINKKITNDESMMNNVEYISKNNKKMMNMMNNVEYDEYMETPCFSTNIKKVCQKCLKEYEANSEDQKICYPCFKKSTGQRNIARDEIVIDIDSPDLHGCMCVSATGINLFNQGYHFELWYADNQKQPHIHIKKIPHIADLTDAQLREYKKLFLQKYIPREFWNDKIPDYNLCIVNHLVAEENKPHFKYKTIKILRSEFNTDKENFCETELLEQAKQTSKEEYKPSIKGSGITAKIIQVISIKDIARQFGLKIRGSKCLCPFHADSKTESLVLYEQQGRFHCFGCNEDGNIIYFYAKLKELKPDFCYKRNQESDNLGKSSVPFHSSPDNNIQTIERGQIEK